MKNKQDISKREKSAAVGLVVCFVAMIAIVGLITFSQYERRADLEQQQLAEAETKENMENGDMDETEPSQITNTDSVQAEIQTQIEDSAPEVIITPSAPAATAAKHIDSTKSAFPVAWLGSIIIGK